MATAFAKIWTGIRLHLETTRLAFCQLLIAMESSFGAIDESIEDPKLPFVSVLWKRATYGESEREFV